MAVGHCTRAKNLSDTSFYAHLYDFKGATDMVLCSQNAVRSNIYTSGMWVFNSSNLLEVKKAPVHHDLIKPW